MKSKSLLCFVLVMIWMTAAAVSAFPGFWFEWEIQLIFAGLCVIAIILLIKPWQ